MDFYALVAAEAFGASGVSGVYVASGVGHVHVVSGWHQLVVHQSNCHPCTCRDL